MQEENDTLLFPDLRTRKVVVADGFGVKIFVRRGRLVIEDGIGPYRRERVFARAATEFKRLVILAKTGFISLDALAWLRALGIGMAQVDGRGRLVLCSAGDGYDDARLRRAQTLAASNKTGIEVARFILSRKVEGQLRLAREMSPAAGTDIQDCLDEIGSASNIESMVQAEAFAANAYWRFWEEIDVPFVRKDLRRLPSEWLRVGPRGSSIASGPRLAVRPVHALLNLAYAVAEIETTIACSVVGLDPGIGLIHRDQVRRSNFALDLLETIRPEIDAWLLRLMKSRPLRYADFVETPRGNCRVVPPLSHEVVATMPAWGKSIGALAEKVAEMFATDTRMARMPTRLTQSRRREARLRQQKRKGSTRVEKGPTANPVCKSCGKHLSALDRVYCDACLREAKLEQVRDMLVRSRTTNEGKARSDESKAKQGVTIRRRNLERTEWETTHSIPDSRVFTEGILPRLGRVPIRKIARATGLSSLYASQIRAGRIPHPMHWEVLRELGNSDSR